MLSKDRVREEIWSLPARGQLEVQVPIRDPRVAPSRDWMEPFRDRRMRKLMRDENTRSAMDEYMTTWREKLRTAPPRAASAGASGRLGNIRQIRGIACPPGNGYGRRSRRCTATTRRPRRGSRGELGDGGCGHNQVVLARSRWPAPRPTVVYQGGKVMADARRAARAPGPSTDLVVVGKRLAPATVNCMNSMNAVTRKGTAMMPPTRMKNCVRSFMRARPPR